MLTNCSLIIKTKRTGVNGVILRWILFKIGLEDVDCVPWLRPGTGSGLLWTR
jgi:hypothetical protein